MKEGETSAPVVRRAPPPPTLSSRTRTKDSVGGGGALLATSTRAPSLEAEQFGSASSGDENVVVPGNAPPRGRIVAPACDRNGQRLSASHGRTRMLRTIAPVPSAVMVGRNGRFCLVSGQPANATKRAHAPISQWQRSYLPAPEESHQEQVELHVHHYSRALAEQETHSTREEAKNEVLRGTQQQQLQSSSVGSWSFSTSSSCGRGIFNTTKPASPVLRKNPRLVEDVMSSDILDDPNFFAREEESSSGGASSSAKPDAEDVRPRQPEPVKSRKTGWLFSTRPANGPQPHVTGVLRPPPVGSSGAASSSRLAPPAPKDEESRSPVKDFLHKTLHLAGSFRDRLRRKRSSPAPERPEKTNDDVPVIGPGAASTGASEPGSSDAPVDHGATKSINFSPGPDTLAAPPVKQQRTFGETLERLRSRRGMLFGKLKSSQQGPRDAPPNESTTLHGGRSTECSTAREHDAPPNSRAVEYSVAPPNAVVPASENATLLHGRSTEWLLLGQLNSPI